MFEDNLMLSNMAGDMRVTNLGSLGALPRGGTPVGISKTRALHLLKCTLMQAEMDEKEARVCARWRGCEMCVCERGRKSECVRIRGMQMCAREGQICTRGWGAGEGGLRAYGNRGG